MLVLDSNVVSELMVARPNDSVVAWLDRQPWSSLWTTSITVFEVRSGLAALPAGRRRETFRVAFERLLTQNFENRVLSFDSAAAEEAAALVEAPRRSGRPRDMRDTMIAGIVLAQHATLVTRNERHFDDLDAIVVNPWRS